MEQQTQTQSSCSFCLFIGRLCLATIFILAGVGKFMDYNGTALYMASKGLPMIPILLIAAASVEIIGGFSLLLGYRARCGAILLILFLIPTTLIFHDFWNYEGAERQALLIEFLKNLAIWGGLFYVLGAGPGKVSIDRCCCKGSCPTSTPKEG